MINKDMNIKFLSEIGVPVQHAQNKEELIGLYVKQTGEVKKKMGVTLTAYFKHIFQHRILFQRDVYGYQTVEFIIKRAYPLAHILTVDYNYHIASRSDYAAFLKVDNTNKAKYVPDLYDCDDFAWRLMGNLSDPLTGAFATGIAMSEGHAFNCCICNDKNMYLIEPQTDELILAPVKGEMYDVTDVIM
jgi:hypothetical protein